MATERDDDLRGGQLTDPAKHPDDRIRRGEARATRSFLAAGAFAWGAVLAIVACEDRPAADPQSTTDTLPVVELDRVSEVEEEDAPGTGGAADAGMAAAADAGRVIRPSKGALLMNVDGGAAGMNAQGEVHAVPRTREGGLSNVALDAGTNLLPGSKRPTK